MSELLVVAGDPGSSKMSRNCRSFWVSLLLLTGLLGGQHDAATVAMWTSASQAATRPEPFAGSRAGEERTVAVVGLCWCPPGKFIMGSPPTEPERRPDEDQVEVTLSRGFWMGKYE